MVVFEFCFGVGQFLTIDGIHHFNFNDGTEIVQAFFQVLYIVHNQVILNFKINKLTK